MSNTTSILNSGTFNAVFDDMLINLLGPKALFSLAQVNKYYNMLITKALPTSNVVKFIDLYGTPFSSINDAILNKIVTAIHFKNVTLFNKFIDTDESKLITDEDLILLLYASIEYNSLNIFKLLLDKVQNIDIFSPNKTMVEICQQGTFECAEILLNNYSANAFNINLWICVALSFGNIEIVKKLDQKYNINNEIKYDCPRTALYCVTKTDFDETSEEYNENDIQYIINPFVLAVELSEFEIIEYYLDNKVDQKILNISVKHLNMPYIVSESLRDNTILPLLNRILNSIKTASVDEDEDYCNLDMFQQFVNSI